MDESRSRLAQAVEDAIADAGLNYQEVAERAGFSVETLTAVRKGRRVRPPILRKLEHALSWPAGRTRTILGLSTTNPLPPPGVTSGWDGQLAGTEQMREGEVLRWKATDRGRAFRLEYPDEGASIDYTFPDEVATAEALASLRGLLDSHRLRLREMGMERGRRG